MKDHRSTQKLTKRQSVFFTVMMRSLYRDLEACGLGARDLARARVRVALYDDDRQLTHVLARLQEHRRPHLN